ncbi:unnamed protein product [Amoebophrya sp. A25]|nr:unnamed protein product [Amoebophrya sp. A25]|eukprot:GSA25T00003312001.1
MSTVTPITDLSQTVSVGSTRWLKLETLTYTDQTGKERKWDRAVRATKQSETSIDAVAILATLVDTATASSSILLVKQFRPAVNAYTLELPAGLVDKNESTGTAALRELKEETGYVGKIVSCGELQDTSGFPLSPGMSNESVSLVEVTVDLSLPENQHPLPSPDEGEFVQVFKVSKNNLLAELTRLQKEDPKVQIFIGLWTLARGIELGKAMMK